MMQLTHRFTVPSPIDVAWDAFNDLERIVPCFPGAALTSFDGESFEGLCKVKLGPISLQYTGRGRFVERDVTTKRAVIEAKGKDKRGNGTAAAAVRAQLTAKGDGTEVEVVTDLAITGRPAQFGRGVMQDVSDKLLKQFAACLETQLAGRVEAPTQVAAPASAADLAAAGRNRAVSTSTPIADRAAKAVQTRSAVDTGGPSVEGSSSPAPPTTDERARPVSSAEPATAELDLGATVLPVLLKRYAAKLGVALLLLVVLRKLVRRR